MAPCLNRIRRNRHGDHQFPQQNKVEAVMRITIAAVVLFLISGNCFAQSSVGGGSSGAAAGGGSAGSSAVAAPAGRGAGSIAPTVPGNGITPIPRAPGVANTPVDPQRNNVDAQPPTRRLPGSTATEPRGPGQPSQPSDLTAAAFRWQSQSGRRKFLASFPKGCRASRRC